MSTPTGKRPKNCYARKGSPFWWYEININGEREAGSTGYSDATSAAAYVDARKTAVRMRQAQCALAPTAAAGFGPVARQKEATWADALQRYHDDISAGTDNERNCLRNAAKLLVGIGDKPLHELSHADFTKYRIDRLKEANPRTGKTISPLTVNREVAHARQVINHMDDLGFRMPPNRPNFGKLIDGEAEKNAARTRELTPVEEKRLMAALEKVHAGFSQLIEFILLCGQRKAAVVNLEWDDIDWDNECFRVKLKGKGKTKREHVVPLTPRMIQIIKAQPDLRPKVGSVFTYVCRRNRFNEDGSYLRREGQRYPYTIAGWKKDWAKALRIAKIEDFRVHDLRHTNASRVVRETGDLTKARKILGHSQITTTARYAHANLDDAREGLMAAERSRAEHQDNIERREKPPLRVVNG